MDAVDNVEILPELLKKRLSLQLKLVGTSPSSAKVQPVLATESGIVVSSLPEVVIAVGDAVNFPNFVTVEVKE